MTVPEGVPADLTACEREPIHIPGTIQPHGMLFVLDPDNLTVRSASANAEDWLKRPAESLLGLHLDDILGPEQAAAIRVDLTTRPGGTMPLYLHSLELGSGGHFHAIVHRTNGSLILELDSSPKDGGDSYGRLYPLVDTFLSKLYDAPPTSGFEQLCAQVATEVRKITGFDRVLIYRFGTDWSGTVIAEDRNDQLPSYYGLRFPASDIPVQARELYRKNRLRLIPDANYQPVPLVPAFDPKTNQPIDLTYAVLRSVSPVHLEYMRNMETLASMSISILRENKLWGLISCHSRTPRTVPIDARTACDLLGQMLSVQVTAAEQRADADLRIRLKSIVTSLLAYMAEESDFIAGLVKHRADLMDFASASGAAVVFQDRIQLVGQTPSEGQVARLVQWLSDRGQDDLFSSDALSQVFPEAAEYSHVASGVLAIAISKVHRSYILWFRPEIIQTVKWAGEPRKFTTNEQEEERISPRKSFELWTQQLRHCSQPWLDAEVDAVSELRNAVLGIVLRRAEELADLNAELEQSNKELEAFSYSVSHDLRAPFRHIVGYAELLREEANGYLSELAQRYIDTIVDSAYFAGTLVDNLLNFSQIGRAALSFGEVDMNSLVHEVKQSLKADSAGRRVRWQIGHLPVVRGDLMLLRQVWSNLLSNALKYSSTREESVIEVAGQRTGEEVVFSVTDNGVGFDMTYADKLFGVFQRLHRIEDFEGTGIGLALVRRIVTRHGGRTWAEGVPDQGATFSFSLPLNQECA